MDRLKVIKFSATWCGPCRAFKPVWQAASTSTVNENIEFQEVDVDSESPFMEKYGVRAVPTFVFLKGDEVAFTKVGGGTADEFQGLINRYLNEA